MFKQFVLSFFFGLTVLFSVAQSDSLLKIPGTNCSIIPPEGFVLADRFTGLQNNSTGASIMINEIPENYSSLVDAITPDALSKQRMILKHSEEIEFNGKKAKLFYLSQSQSGIEYQKTMLLFGVDLKSVMVNGIYPSSQIQLEPAIKKSILSTKYLENSINAKPEIFEISTKGTSFKLVNSVMMNRVYSTDSLAMTKGEAPLFILSNSVSKVSQENRKSYAESRMMSLPRGDKNKIQSTTEISIAGLDGYEVIADGVSKTGAPQKTYLVILYNVEGDYYVMVGSSSTNIEDNMKLFKQMANTFSLRKQ